MMIFTSSTFVTVKNYFLSTMIFVPLKTVQVLSEAVP